MYSRKSKLPRGRPAPRPLVDQMAEWSNILCYIYDTGDAPCALRPRGPDAVRRVPPSRPPVVSPRRVPLHGVRAVRPAAACAAPATHAPPRSRPLGHVRSVMSARSRTPRSRPLGHVRSVTSARSRPRRQPRRRRLRRSPAVRMLRPRAIPVPRPRPRSPPPIL